MRVDVRRRERETLTDEAAQLARDAEAAPQDSFEPSGTSADALIASLAARAHVDALNPSGRVRSVKRVLLRSSMVFLREQAVFNRLTVTVLEDLNRRLDTVEARLEALAEAKRTGTEPRA